MKNKKIVIIIGGPTSSGKSNLALDIAKKEGGSIINADSKQIYGYLPILTASPTVKDKKEIPHFLYDKWNDIHQICSASLWRKKAVHFINNSHKRNIIPCIVGGTGFYLQTLIQGLSPIPYVPQSIRTEATKYHQIWGNKKFYNYICKIDPEISQNLHFQDTQRLIRAFEVITHTGIKLSKWQKKEKIMGEKKLWYFHIILLKPDKIQLYKKSSSRIKFMFKNGAIEEVKKIIKLKLQKNHPLLKAVGVQEIIEYLKGGTLKEAIAKSEIRTNKYIKKQLTWFKKHLKAEQIIEKVYPGNNPCDTLEKIILNLRNNI